LKEAAPLVLAAIACALVVLVVWDRVGGGGANPDNPPVVPKPTEGVSEAKLPPPESVGFDGLGGGPNGYLIKKPTAAELLKRYPLESLANRLEYEKGRDTTPTAAMPEPAAQRLAVVEQGFTDREAWNRRVKSLAKLHSNQVEQFISEDGFGVSRMMPMTAPIYLELAEASPIPFANLASLPAGGEGARVELPRTAGMAGAEARLPSLEALGTFHESGRIDFLNIAGFGFVKDRDHVAGFQSHQFRQMPVVRERRVPQQVRDEEDRWAVRRLELVSLLKHEQPAVYVSDHLPRMDDLKKAQTRPLSEFERKALKSIREGEDLVAEATQNRIHLMGSLRASKQCLECHHAQRGDLLGAFSYELQRDSSAGK
jgi:hypothetical protein